MTVLPRWVLPLVLLGGSDVSGWVLFGFWKTFIGDWNLTAPNFSQQAPLLADSDETHC